MDNTAQKTPAAYRLAWSDPDFLLGDSMRGTRFMMEFQKVEEHLRAWGVRSTVVVFGSARVMPAGSADPAQSSASLLPGARPCPGPRAAHWYEQARRFGRIVSERGGALSPADGIRDNVIATGGGPGLMEAANRGAFEAGAPSIGFNVELPHEQEPNAYTTPDLTFRFHYFGMRKVHLALRAAALVVFPGGFGTMDELFEILTLVQTRKSDPIPIVCFDRSYWTRVINFQAMAEECLISPEDVDLFGFADDADEAWDELVRRGLRARAVAEPASAEPSGPR
jgi:uncharacterized protein (TIGR00730 family)